MNPVWTLAPLLLAACLHVPPSPPSLAALAASELELVTAAPDSEPFEMVLDDTPAGERLLRQPSLPVDPQAPWLPHLEARMRLTLEREQGVGLAAPQIGLSRQAILVQRQDKADDPAEGPVELYLNPVIIEKGLVAESGWEGCLSVPAGFGQVVRPSGVRVAYELPGGERQDEWVHGWTARIFQHEIDHLDGVLFHDYVQGELMPEDEYRALRAAERAQEAPVEPQDTGAP
jgi:peptide deformylase